MSVVLNYVPHGINPKIFYPITEQDGVYAEFIKFRDEFYAKYQVDFIVFWNNRNIRRKQPGDVVLAFRRFCDKLSESDRNRCGLLMHTDPIDENGTDLIAVQRAVAYNCKVLFSDSRIDDKILNFYYNLAALTLNIASNEGFGLSSAESIMAGTPVVNNVTGGLQDQMRFESDDHVGIKFDSKFTTNHNGTYKKCGPWAYPVFPSNISLQGSVMTPYIFDERCSFDDIADGIYYWFRMHEDDRKNFGRFGREWMMSEESRMSADSMCDHVINSIDRCLTEFKPRQKFKLIKLKTNNTSKLMNDHLGIVFKGDKVNA